ncbi:hypothetical protein BC829DRAFT_453456 [Chytridium lagenaria]|nr:hypothetical protein BC829DRAFT_453456 [Chytridium lagenaria]
MPLPFLEYPKNLRHLQLPTRNTINHLTFHNLVSFPLPPAPNTMSGQSNVRKFGTVLSKASLFIQRTKSSQLQCSTPPHSSPTHSTFSKKGHKENVPPPQPRLSPLDNPFRGLSEEPETSELLLLAGSHRIPNPLKKKQWLFLNPFPHVPSGCTLGKPTPSTSAMEVDVQPAPQSTSEMIGGGISSRQRRRREAEDDGDSPTKRRRQGVAKNFRRQSFLTLIAGLAGHRPPWPSRLWSWKVSRSRSNSIVSGSAKGPRNQLSRGTRKPILIRNLRISFEGVGEWEEFVAEEVEYFLSVNI